MKRFTVRHTDNVSTQHSLTSVCISCR